MPKGETAKRHYRNLNPAQRQWEKSLRGKKQKRPKSCNR